MVGTRVERSRKLEFMLIKYLLKTDFNELKNYFFQSVFKCSQLTNETLGCEIYSYLTIKTPERSY